MTRRPWHHSCHIAMVRFPRTIPGTPFGFKPETARRSATNFSGSNQPAVIDRFFCKLDCLFGGERIG